MKLLNPYAIPAQHPPTAAYLVSKLRQVVDGWRAQDYPGVSDTTRRLLTYWFFEDHRSPDGKPFGYYFCQREAIETLIYCYEVAQTRSFAKLMQDFGSSGGVYYDPTADRFPRYVFKMATGSGKTKVMSLAMVWSYFHGIKEPNSPLAKTFLLIAPNVIVFERLKQDFADGKIFREDPLVPPEWASDWQMRVILQDEPAPATTVGTLYLTNVQRLYERKPKEEVNPVEVMVGPKPKLEIKVSAEELIDRILRHPDLMVFNDEAHHVHDEDLVWYQTIVNLHEELQSRGVSGLVAQLDFSATPKTQQGRLFPQIIVDYPVAQAIQDGIVKQPILGEIGGPVQIPSNDASVRYRQWIDAGIAKWRDYWTDLQKSGKKPVLFVMTEDTRSADDIRDYLETLPDLKNHVLTIHTDKKGEITKKELDDARQASREVDSDQNPYRVIVSVLMLREGWDVRNVVVIVPLRPYTAKANILPEQTLGRGLRRMTGPGSGFEERVIVVEHDAFRDFWDKELKEEGLEIERDRLENVRIDIKTIIVESTKLEFDIEIPQLSPVLSRSVAALKDLDLDKIPKRTISLPSGYLVKEDTIHYTGRHMLTREIVEKKDLLIPFPDQPEGVIAYFSQMILKEARMPGRFAELVPLVKEYIRTILFGHEVELNSPAVLRRLSEPDARQIIITVFAQAINSLTIESHSVYIQGSPIKLSGTNAFPWTKETYPAHKTIFNLVACDSHYEAEFAAFLDGVPGVAAFAKNTEATHFAIEYLSSQGGVRYYYPDFIVRLVSGEMFLVETKGLEDIEVARKDARATKWCQDATMLTGLSWHYIKVPENVFRSTTATTFEQLYRHALAATQL